MSHQDLTERHKRILRLAATGLTQGQIGKREHLSRGYIAEELTRARRHLGARSTAHAAALAVHLGIVTAEDLELEDRLGFAVQGIGLHGAPGDLSLHCNRCPWALHTSDRLTLAELNQRAAEHLELP